MSKGPFARKPDGADVHGRGLGIERGERGLDVIEFCALVSALGEDPAKILRRLLDQLPRKIEI